MISGPVVAAVAAGAALLVGGCGASAGTDTSAGAGHPAAHAPPSSTTTTTTRTPTSGVPAPVMTVEQLATAIGCQAQLEGTAADFRQAHCTVDGAQVVLLDFDTTDGMRAWLDSAQMYGGIYLVGTRWALSGKSTEYLESIRAKLGGTIEPQSTR